MIELNLLEKKQPLVLPIVMGMDLNTVNLKMLGLSIIIYYLPGFIVSAVYEKRIQETQDQLTQITEQNAKITDEIGKEGDVRTRVDAYKTQVVKLQERSTQVDEILKNRTNPKKVLEKIARSIPEDVWFNSMVINTKNEVVIQGGSYSARAIGEFISTINDSPYFGNSIIPSMQENKKETFDGITTSFEAFELKGKIINYDMRSK